MTPEKSRGSFDEILSVPYGELKKILNGLSPEVQEQILAEYAKMSDSQSQETTGGELTVASTAQEVAQIVGGDEVALTLEKIASEHPNLIDAFRNLALNVKEYIGDERDFQYENIEKYILENELRKPEAIIYISELLFRLGSAVDSIGLSLSRISRIVDVKIGYAELDIKELFLGYLEKSHRDNFGLHRGVTLEGAGEHALKQSLNCLNTRDSDVFFAPTHEGGKIDKIFFKSRNRNIDFNSIAAFYLMMFQHIAHLGKEIGNIAKLVSAYEDSDSEKLKEGKGTIEKLSDLI